MIVPLLFFGIALLYASVGFGGGSSYLALLSLLVTDFMEVRTTALLLNLIVVGVGTVVHIRHRVFSWREFWPFVALSIPAAFLGARLRLSESGFFLALGASLICSAIFMLLQSIRRKVTQRPLSHVRRLAMGGGVGFLSGLVGIGGGIFLSPILNIYGWANPKTIASLASVFILFNSLSGLAGLAAGGSFQLNATFSMGIIVAVFLGGLAGSYISSSRFNIHLVRSLTALLVAYVGVRIILQYGFGIKI